MVLPCKTSHNLQFVVNPWPVMSRGAPTFYVWFSRGLAEQAPACNIERTSKINREAYCVFCATESANEDEDHLSRDVHGGRGA
jgi:hypothetical protein